MRFEHVGLSLQQIRNVYHRGSRILEMLAEHNEHLGKLNFRRTRVLLLVIVFLIAIVAYKPIRFAYKVHDQSMNSNLYIDLMLSTLQAEIFKCIGTSKDDLVS